MNVEERLLKAIEKRDNLSGEIQRIQGKKQAAEQALRNIEQEIREAGLDPETIEETLQKLEVALEKNIQDYESQLGTVEQQLNPYMEI